MALRTMWIRLLDMDENRPAPHKSTDLSYMKILRTYMRLNVSWPYKAVGENPPRFSTFLRILLICCTLVNFTLQYLYLRNRYKILSFYEMGHCFFTMILTTLALNRYTMPFGKSYQVVAKEFVCEMHLFYFRNKSEYAKKVFLNTTKISAAFTVFTVIQLYSGSTIYNLAPLYNNFKAGMFSANKPINGTYQQSVNYELQFIDPYHNLRAYVVLALLNQYLATICVGSISASELFLSLMVINVVGHLKILRNELDTFPRPGHFGLGESNGITYNGNELPVVEDKLKELVDYHRLLLGFTERMTHSYSFMLFFYYVFHQVSGCLLLFLVSQLDTESLMLYGPITGFMFQQLIQLSVIFEYMGTESDRLVSSVYGLPWESMDVGSIKTVQIFLRQVQRPIELKAAGVARVGCTSMAVILKTTFTYFMLLRTLPN